MTVKGTVGGQLGGRGGWPITSSEEKMPVFRGLWNNETLDVLTAEEVFWMMYSHALGLRRGLFTAPLPLPVLISFHGFLKPPMQLSSLPTARPWWELSRCQNFGALAFASLRSSSCSFLNSTPHSLNLPCLFSSLRHYSPGFFHWELFLLSGSFFWGLIQMILHSKYSQRERGGHNPWLDSLLLRFKHLVIMWFSQTNFGASLSICLCFLCISQSLRT